MSSEPLYQKIEKTDGLPFEVIKKEISDSRLDEETTERLVESVTKVSGFEGMARQFHEDAKEIRDMEKSQRPEDEETLEHFYEEETELMSAMEEAARGVEFVEEKKEDARSQMEETDRKGWAQIYILEYTVYMELLFRFGRSYRDVVNVCSILENLCNHHKFTELVNQAKKDEPAIENTRSNAEGIDISNRFDRLREEIG